MLPVIIFLLLRRYHRMQNGAAPEWIEKLKRRLPLVTRIIILILTYLIIVPVVANSQSQKLQYCIIRNGKSIGMIHLSQSTTGSGTEIKLESEIKFSFLFSFTAASREECKYENGILQYSLFNRRVNGHENANKVTTICNASYHVTGKDHEKVLECFPIRYCLLCMFCNEPTSISKVYSHNLEQFLDVEKLEPNKYKVTMPDGNYNYYTYKNGLCTNVDIHHGIYRVQFVLIQ
jgi:hypothetical protein